MLTRHRALLFVYNNIDNMNINRNPEIDSEVIKAVHDDQFETFLANIGVLDNVKAGNCKCKFCDTPVTLDNIYTVFPESGQIKFSCDNVKCMVKLSKYLTSK